MKKISFKKKPKNPPKKNRFFGHGFLDASSHLYMRVCPSVRPSVSIKEKTPREDASDGRVSGLVTSDHEFNSNHCRGNQASLPPPALPLATYVSESLRSSSEATRPSDFRARSNISENLTMNFSKAGFSIEERLFKLKLMLMKLFASAVEEALISIRRNTSSSHLSHLILSLSPIV